MNFLLWMIRSSNSPSPSDLENGSLKSGMPLKITYMGKKKNKTNNFQSDNWSVRPLRLNLPVAG